MNKVYIISRYKSNFSRNQEFNKDVARYFCRKIIDEGNIPVAPHLFYTQFLDDNYQYDRELGLNLGLWELCNSDEFLLVVIDGVISEGMRYEIEQLSRLGIPGRIVTMKRQEILEAMKVVR